MIISFFYVKFKDTHQLFKCTRKNRIIKLSMKDYNQFITIHSLLILKSPINFIWYFPTNILMYFGVLSKIDFQKHWTLKVKYLFLTCKLLNWKKSMKMGKTKCIYTQLNQVILSNTHLNNLLLLYHFHLRILHLFALPPSPQKFAILFLCFWWKKIIKYHIE